MPFEMKINRNREFAIAYRIFTSLSDAPFSTAQFAIQCFVSRKVMSYIIRRMKDAGCAVTKRGGNGIGGTYKIHGVTVKDLFERYNRPFEEGPEFEEKISSIINSYARDRKCVTCGKFCPEATKTGTCKTCSKLNNPIFSSKRLARCGHYSLTRYFKCELCQPVLEDNQTPDDWGVGLSL